MKKNDIFIDISAYQNQSASVYSWHNTVIKVSESTNWLSPVRTTQAATSNPIGYYHFARFGGNVSQAIAEANFFIGNLPDKKVKYLVCDYEDSASTLASANTAAVLAFMDTCSKAGYTPILYSYIPYIHGHLEVQRVIEKYPKSLWIAAYITMQLNPNYEQKDYTNLTWNLANYGLTWVLPHIRWFQYSSTAINDGLDINVVLIDDAETKAQTKSENTKRSNLMFIYTLTDTSTVGGHTFGKGAKFLVNPVKGTTTWLHPDTWNAHKESLSTLPQEKGGSTDFTSFVALVGAGKVIYNK